MTPIKNRTIPSLLSDSILPPTAPYKNEKEIGELQSAIILASSLVISLYSRTPERAIHPEGAPQTIPMITGYTPPLLTPKSFWIGLLTRFAILSAVPELIKRPLITKIGKSVGAITLTQRIIPCFADSEAVDEKTRKVQSRLKAIKDQIIEAYFFNITNSSVSFRIFLTTILFEKRKNDLSRIKRFLETFTELPSSSFSDRPYIEMEGDNTFKLDGCEEILSYDEHTASFITKESRITVSGDSLMMCSFGNSTVRVTGNITRVEIERIKG